MGSIWGGSRATAIDKSWKYNYVQLEFKMFDFSHNQNPKCTKVCMEASICNAVIPSHEHVDIHYTHAFDQFVG